MSQARLAELIQSKRAVIGVVGLGYVGLPLALAFGRDLVNTPANDMGPEALGEAAAERRAGDFDAAIDAGRAVVVGVNQFADASASRVAVFRVDPEMERRQIDRLRALRAGRSEHAWSEAVSAVDRAARSIDSTRLCTT